MRILLFLLLPLFLTAQERDISLNASYGAFGVVLDTFNAPVGPGFELGASVAYNGFIAIGNVKRGYVGTKSNTHTYNVIQAGLGGTHNVFYFAATLDYMVLAKQLETKTNGGAIGMSLRFGADLPITDKIGLFGVVSLGVNRLHTFMYTGLGASYHFPYDNTAQPEAFYR